MVEDRVPEEVICNESCIILEGRAKAKEIFSQPMVILYEAVSI